MIRYANWYLCLVSGIPHYCDPNTPCQYATLDLSRGVRYCSVTDTVYTDTLFTEEKLPKRFAEDAESSSMDRLEAACYDNDAFASSSSSATADSSLSNPLDDAEQERQPPPQANTNGELERSATDEAIANIVGRGMKRVAETVQGVTRRYRRYVPKMQIGALHVDHTTTTAAATSSGDAATKAPDQPPRRHARRSPMQYVTEGMLLRACWSYVCHHYGGDKADVAQQRIDIVEYMWHLYVTAFNRYNDTASKAKSSKPMHVMTFVFAAAMCMLDYGVHLNGLLELPPVTTGFRFPSKKVEKSHEVELIVQPTARQAIAVRKSIRWTTLANFARKIRSLYGRLHTDVAFRQTHTVRRWPHDGTRR
jgi:hypothetical protein